MKKYTSSETSEFTVKDIRRSENTVEILKELLLKIKDASSKIVQYRSHLFDTNHKIKSSWKVNEMKFYDAQLETYSKMENATELAIGKINSIKLDLKRKFTTSSADMEEDKRIKKRKQENSIKTANDKKKRLLASSLSLLQKLADEETVDSIKEAKNLSEISHKISLSSLENILCVTKLLPRFHLSPLQHLIENNLFEEGDALDKANETLSALKEKRDETSSLNQEEKRKHVTEKAKRAQSQATLVSMLQKNKTPVIE